MALVLVAPHALACLVLPSRARYLQDARHLTPVLGVGVPGGILRHCLRPLVSVLIATWGVVVMVEWVERGRRGLLIMAASSWAHYKKQPSLTSGFRGCLGAWW